MSLYDDLDTDKKSENVSGWASGIKFMQNHMHLKKAGVTAPKRDQVRKSAILAPVVDFNKAKTVSVLKEDPEDGGSPVGFSIPYSMTAPTKETRKKGSKFRISPYLSSDPQWQFENEYDPMFPNDYEKALKDLRERRDKEAEEEENKRKQDEIKDEDEYVPPVASTKSNVGGVAIAPPSSYGLTEPTAELMDSGGGGGYSGGGGGGGGASAAARIMAKYGYKEGQGLGKMQQGMATALQVEKTSHRTGRIIHEKDEPKGILLNSSFTSGGMMPTSLVQYTEDDMAESETDLDDIGTPSKVILLKNMVGPGEVDDDLEPEVKDECQTKYGEVESVTVFQMPDVDSDDAIRIFVDFKKVEDAAKAIQDLNGRFFGGRQVRAAYYDIEKFHNLELTD